jgi:AsmA protein
LRIYPLVLTVDQTTARGRVDADWHTHRYQADLVVNRLDVDSYLPAATVPATPSSAPVPATSAASAVSNTSLRAHLRLGTLIVHGLTLTAVDARMQVAGGRVLLAPVSADLYGGTAAATLTATITSPTPMMRATGRLRGVHVGALLRALRLFPVLSGRLAARTQLAGRGMTVMALERTLSGTVRLAIHQGTLTGLDLDAIGQEARQLTGAHRVQRQVGTAFHDLRASAVITNGVVHTQDLVIRTAHAVGQGTASVNLPAKDLNALLTVALPGELAVPVRVQGPFGHVRFRVALGQLFTQPGAAQRLGTAAKTLGNGLKRLLGLP